MADTFPCMVGRRASEIEPSVNPPPSKQFTWVYMLLDAANRLVKIGSSKTPEKRVHELQVGNAAKLEFLGAVWDPAYRGRGEKHPMLEQRLHEHFAAYHVRGEWFYVEDELEEMVRTWPPGLLASAQFPKTTGPAPRKRLNGEEQEKSDA